MTLTKADQYATRIVLMQKQADSTLNLLERRKWMRRVESLKQMRRKALREAQMRLF